MRKISQKACKISLIIVTLFTAQIGHTEPIDHTEKNTAAPNWKCTLQYRGGPGAACYYTITPNIDISTGLLWHFGLITGCAYCGYKKNNDTVNPGNKLKFVRTKSLAIPLIVRFHRQGNGNLGLNIGLNLDFITSGSVYDITKEHCQDITSEDLKNCIGKAVKIFTGDVKDTDRKKLSEISDASKVMWSILVGLDYEFEGGSNFGIEYLHGLNSAIPLDKTWGNFNINFTFGYNLIQLFM